MEHQFGLDWIVLPDIVFLLTALTGEPTLVMSVETNKAIVRRFIEVGWGKLNIEVFHEILSPNCVRHSAGAVSSGHLDAKLALERVAAGLRELQVTVELLLGDGDMVAIRSRTRAVHTGTYLGITATGQRVDFTAVDFYRLSNGVIVESWHNVDEAGLLRQLGAAP